MPHLKHLFHFARQKRDIVTRISGVKMWHQMSIRVAIVALGLVLIRAG